MQGTVQTVCKMMTSNSSTMTLEKPDCNLSPSSKLPLPYLCVLLSFAWFTYSSWWMRNCTIWDAIYIQIGTNSNFSGADVGLELHHLCLDKTGTGSGSVLQTRHGMSMYFPPTSKGGWWEGMDGDMLLLSCPWYWQIGSPQQHENLMICCWDCRATNDSEASLLSRRTYACLFSTSGPPRLNSGTMPRCANWDDRLKLTEWYI